MEATVTPVAEFAESRPSPVLCVHIAVGGAEHSIWFADRGCDLEREALRVGQLSVAWRELSGGLLRGQAALGRDTLCECYLVAAGDMDETRESLRSQGVSRTEATLIARMPERPLLATFARHAAEIPPATLRRLHQFLLATAETCTDPAC
jgi:hypothetical protein